MFEKFSLGGQEPQRSDKSYTVDSAAVFQAIQSNLVSKNQVKSASYFIKSIDTW